MRSTWLNIPTRVEPYSQLALIYDYVMRHVNYGRWANYMRDLFSHADQEVVRVLDIACGTGSLILKLSELGFRVAGFDESLGMVQEARAKGRARRLRIPFWRASMRSFALRRPVDAIVCTYDSINYCLDEATCAEVFDSVALAVRPGGLLVFDICTVRNSRKHFRRYYEKEETEEFRYIRQSYYIASNSIQVNEFYIQRESSPLVREIHQQRIYKIDEIMKTIPGDRFQVMGVYDGFSMKSGSEESDRVHFVLKRTQGGSRPVAYAST